MHEKTAPTAKEQTTVDGILNRRITLEQPAAGYRVAVDTVFLAAAVPARAGEKVLDLGCGVGGAMLCLAARVPHVSVLGVEIQDALRLMCRDNIVRNNLKADLSVQSGDATGLSPALGGHFHHVMMNPPYHDETQHDVSPHTQRRIANTEKSGDLVLWIANAALALRPGGCLTLIHRADRLEEVLGYMAPHFGQTEIYKIMAKAGTPPKRVIVRARKAVPAGITQTHELVLHRDDGGYTDTAEAILRDGAALA